MNWHSISKTSNGKLLGIGTTANPMITKQEEETGLKLL
jgi:hypothetical protein